MRFARPIVLLALAMQPLACSTQAMGMDQNATQESTQSLQMLQGRADQHLSRMGAATDRSAAEAEVDAYVAEIAPSMTDMATSCATMMRASDSADAAGAADFMMDAVRGYASAAHAAADLDSMRALAKAHHDKLSAMIRYMQSMLAGMRMMTM